MRAILQAAGDPQVGVRGALVAGTNGKGSTSAILAAILQAAGHRVGTMPSPHLSSYTERIQVDGEPIGEAEFAAAVDHLRPRLQAVSELGPPTEFEILTAIALAYLAPRCDRLVIEVGMGGRLDATNVLDLGTAVITNVDFDHMQYLGDTLEAIAGEKAGIVKAGNAVVAGATGVARRVVEDRVREVGGRLIGLPLLNIPLPPDIVSRRFVQTLVADVATPETPVDNLIAALAGVPEMAASLTPPELWIGEPDNACGRVAVMMAGGTNGGYPVFKTLYDVGVGTILAMHIDEGDFLRLRSDAPAGCSFIVTGHMASDSIGINRLIWELEDAGLECLRTSGVIGAPRPAPA